jgi:hypothetical protein
MRARDKGTVIILAVLLGLAVVCCFDRVAFGDEPTPDGGTYCPYPMIPVPGGYWRLDNADGCHWSAVIVDETATYPTADVPNRVAPDDVPVFEVIDVATDDTALMVWKPTRTMKFYGEDQQEVGTVDWSDGAVRFTGNVDASARVFFEAMIDLCRAVECDQEGGNP